MSLRAHYVSASQRLATSRLGTDAVTKALHGLVERRATSMAFRRVRLAIAREGEEWKGLDGLGRQGKQAQQT